MNTADRQAALERARRGDAAALGALLDSFRPYLRVIVHDLRHGRLAARVDDSDHVQDALLEAHRSFPEFVGTSLGEFVAWLRRIVIRSVRRTLRDQAAQKRDPRREQALGDLDCLLADADSSPSSRAARHEEEVLVADAVGRLPDDMRTVVLGRHVEGRSHADLAAQLGRTEGAVRILYVRALQRLRELLGVEPGP